MNIKSIPKIDLHCHLDGSLSLETIKQILPDEYVNIDDKQLLEQLTVNDNCKSLTEYLEKFDLPLKCLQSARNLKLAAYNLVRDVSKENVKYIEIRFAPMLSVNENLSCSEVIESVVNGAKSGEREFGVLTNVIVCAMRHHSYQMNKEMLDHASEFFGKGVCALDLAGDENKFPTKDHIELFKDAKKIGMPFTIHSGETGNIENIRIALELGASRLGHGIALIKDKALIKTCKNKKIGIEVCPTSNLQTKAVKDLKDHPMGEYLKNDLLVSVNTDNRTVSNTNSTKELEIAENMYGKNIQDLMIKIYINSVVSSFASDEIKNQLVMY